MRKPYDAALQESGPADIEKEIMVKLSRIVRTSLKLDLLPFIFVIVLDGRQPVCVLCLDKGQKLFA